MGMTETAILKTAAHELTHFIQANSAQYEALKSFVVNKLTHEEGVSFEDLVADKQRREPGLEYNEAVDEVVADACEMMLGDSTVVEQLAKENRSLAEKIRDWLREWVENLKIALEGLQTDRTESRAMMQYARELQEIWDNALMDAARNNRGTVEAESRQQASPRKKYWRPDLTENEWQLLERRMGEEIGSRENFLDEATKWVYANEKGVQVFALYGIGDGTDATPLYAVGGEKAAAAAADMQKFVNGGYHYDKGTGTALSRIRGFLRTQGDGGGDIRETSRGGSAGTDDALYGGERKGNAGKSAERGSEDQRGVKEKFSMREPVEETRDLLALHNMTMDNLPAELRIGLEKQGATVREYKAGDEQSRLEAVNADERVRFSVREVGGETMPVLDIQNDTRDYKVAETYLKTLVNTEHPFATILVDAQPVYIGKDLPGEYKGSEYTHGLNSSTRQVKMQAATNLDEMLLLAENGEWRDNVKEKHKQDAKNGWYRYSTRFALPVLDIKKAVDHCTVYSGTLLIRNDADGKSYLYDLLDIKKEKVISSPSFSAQERSEVFEPKPSQEQYMQNSRESQAENIEKNQQRDPRLSDRDVLRMAADMAQRDRSQRWSVDDLNRFDLLQRKLLQLDEANAELEALKEERKVLLAGRKVKELTRDEQFDLAQNRNRTETQKGKMFVNRIQRVARNNIS